jgi:hypothetical protein
MRPAVHRMKIENNGYFRFVTVHPESNDSPQSAQRTRRRKMVGILHVSYLNCLPTMIRHARRVKNEEKTNFSVTSAISAVNYCFGALSFLSLMEEIHGVLR